jgi:hypothetical protein
MQLAQWGLTMKINLEEAVAVAMQAHFEIYGSDIESMFELEVRRILMARYCAAEANNQHAGKSLLQG